ncbi:MAG TPA: arsenate reductase ArsC [Tepidisphaeraceae bacterium]|nr:arsenate reductase ArsC [Tepidisphaeraceae bacterium]
MSPRPLVLILCTGNSCRSQMAEGFLRAFQGDKYEVASAGTDPKPEVHPLAVLVMAEAGVDLTSQGPRSIDEFLGRVPVRHLIIVCDRASATCPRIWPGAATRTNLPFDDPADAHGTETEQLEVFRRVRDEIAGAMKVWSPPARKTFDRH